MSTELLNLLSTAIDASTGTRLAVSSASAAFLTMCEAGRASEALADLLFLRPERGTGKEKAGDFNKVANAVRKYMGEHGWDMSVKGTGTCEKRPDMPIVTEAAPIDPTLWDKVQASLLALRAAGNRMVINMPGFPRFNTKGGAGELDAVALLTERNRAIRAAHKAGTELEAARTELEAARTELEAARVNIARLTELANRGRLAQDLLVALALNEEAARPAVKAAPAPVQRRAARSKRAS